MYKHSTNRGQVKKKNFDEYISFFNEKKFLKENTIYTTKTNNNSNTKSNTKSNKN